MKASRLLLGVSVAASAAYLAVRPLTADEWPVVFAVLSTLLLSVVGFGVNRLLGGALALSCLGDFLLGVRRLGSVGGESLFLLGLGSFLLAHLVFIAMFRRYRLAEWWKPGAVRLVGVLTILIVLGSMLAALWNSLGSLRLPVVVYALVLCSMGISAILADLGNPLAGIGALLFISSDAMIAIDKFRGHFPGSGPLIWITYYAAQFLILSGIAKQAGTKATDGLDHG